MLLRDGFVVFVMSSVAEERSLSKAFNTALRTERTLADFRQMEEESKHTRELERQLEFYKGATQSKFNPAALEAMFASQTFNF